MSDILSSIPVLDVKLIFAAHFCLLCFSQLGIWAAQGYLFYNFIYILTLLWSVHKRDSDEPLQVAIFVNGISIIMDIVVLAMYFPSGILSNSREVFFGTMAIIHLLFRPISCLMLLKIHQERISLNGGVSSMFEGPRNSSYQDIDKNAGPTSSNQGGYTFPSAQQI